ncbi:MAG: hypothetical protein ACHQVK_02370, partial [Candidatus Paceibacterales bacterium]
MKKTFDGPQVRSLPIPMPPKPVATFASAPLAVPKPHQPHSAPHSKPSRNFSKSRFNKTSSAPRQGFRDTTETGAKVSPGKPNTLRIIPLGGMEEVGRNMTVFEYNQD